jgi:hypothetical protein
MGPWGLPILAFALVGLCPVFANHAMIWAVMSLSGGPYQHVVGILSFMRLILDMLAQPTPLAAVDNSHRPYHSKPPVIGSLSAMAIFSTANLKASRRWESRYATCLRRGLEVDRHSGVDLHRAASGAKGFVAPERHSINGGLT